MSNEIEDGEVYSDDEAGKNQQDVDDDDDDVSCN